MKIETLEIKGFVCLHNEDVFLEEKKIDEDYYPKVESIGEIVAEHFSKLSKPVTVSFSDWTRGRFVAYQDVFCRYFVSEDKTTWNESQEEQIKSLAGAVDTEHRQGGYNEYTITESWTELFVGGHDLRNELKSFEGKYVIIRIDYKI